jgi:hypothetical protein
MATLLAVLFAVYQSYKMFVSRDEQPAPQEMAMAAGR